jgi:large subunit ribosomal protein L9
MKVIFTKTNEVKDVSFGHAVNYLIPQGLAVKATKETLAKIEAKKAAAAEQKEKEEKKELELAKKFEGKEFIIRAKAGKNGRLFGAITKKELAGRLGVNKNIINLQDLIKKTGDYLVDLKLGGEKVKVKVRVEKE